MQQLSSYFGDINTSELKQILDNSNNDDITFEQRRNGFHVSNGNVAIDYVSTYGQHTVKVYFLTTKDKIALTAERPTDENLSDKIDCRQMMFNPDSPFSNFSRTGQASYVNFSAHDSTYFNNATKIMKEVADKLHFNGFMHKHKKDPEFDPLNSRMDDMKKILYSVAKKMQDYIPRKIHMF